MPDPSSHHPHMFIIRPNKLPAFWWLNPWATARRLHKTCAALKAQSDRQDRRAAELIGSGDQMARNYHDMWSKFHGPTHPASMDVWSSSKERYRHE